MPAPASQPVTRQHELLQAGRAAYRRASKPRPETMTALTPQLHQTNQNSAASAPKTEIPVWDRALRIFHWLLAGTVAGAALTGFFGGATSLDLHIISGTAIALLLTFRVIWGFTGPDYARFKSFVPAPASFLHHARELLRGGASDYLGHNPVGSAMILALLAVACGDHRHGRRRPWRRREGGAACPVPLLHGCRSSQGGPRASCVPSAGPRWTAPCRRAGRELADARKPHPRHGDRLQTRP